MLVLKIDAVSDVICPWCFLGSTRLATALTTLQDMPDIPAFQSSVKWYPHFLFPNQTVRKDKRTSYLKRFNGNEGKVLDMEAMFRGVLQPLGEDYILKGTITSTLDAHRVSEWVLENHGEDAQWKLMQKLFRAYHSHGLDLSDHQVLADVAETVGVKREVILSLLESEELKEDVLQIAGSNASSLSLGLFTGGVPHFKIQVKDMVLELPGAQDVEYFVNILGKMLRKNAESKL